MHTILVKSNDDNKRIDRFLEKTLHQIPLSLVYKYLRTKHIKLNGKKVSPDTRIHEGDTVTLYIADEFFDASEKTAKSSRLEQPYLTLRPEEIVYEDANILLIDKKQGELVHADLPDEKPQNQNEPCLVDRMTGYLYKKGEYAPNEENSFVPALCNRLDRNTSGIVIAAKNAKALAVLCQKIKDREMTKKYRCLVSGNVKNDAETLTDYLWKDRDKNRVFVFSSREDAKKKMHIRYDDDIKKIVTNYRVLERHGDTTLLEVELVTGRTHQIRAHLAYIGHPIVGDGKYGVNHASASGVKYQMLCACYLQFHFTTDAGPLAYLSGKEFFSKQTLSQ